MNTYENVGITALLFLYKVCLKQPSQWLVNHKIWGSIPEEKESLSFYIISMVDFNGMSQLVYT